MVLGVTVAQVFLTIVLLIRGGDINAVKKSANQALANQVTRKIANEAVPSLAMAARTLARHQHKTQIASEGS